MNGVDLRREQIPLHAVEKARRLLHLEVSSWGLSLNMLREWRTAACWFPTLRSHHTILKLLDYLPAEWQTGQLAEPQILWQFPDVGLSPLVPHLDAPPPWAKGRGYLRIVGVPLTEQRRSNGGLVTWPGGRDGKLQSVDSDPGDCFAFPPDLLHTSGANISADIRQIVYFRFLEEE